MNNEACHQGHLNRYKMSVHNGKRLLYLVYPRFPLSENISFAPNLMPNVLIVECFTACVSHPKTFYFVYWFASCFHTKIERVKTCCSHPRILRLLVDCTECLSEIFLGRIIKFAQDQHGKRIEPEQ